VSVVANVRYSVLRPNHSASYPQWDWKRLKQVYLLWYFLKILKNSWHSKKTCFVSINLSYAQSLVWHHNLTTVQSDRLDALQKRALRIIWTQLHYYTTLPSLYVTLSLLSWDDAIFSRNSLNIFAILGTVCMTSSNLNVILLFLSDCSILQFTPSLRSEQNGTALS